MLIDCQDLHIRLSGAPILNGISFSVSEGDYLCITGPNGSGKSTLLRCLNGITTATSGEVTLMARALRHYRQKQIAAWVSYVPQNSGRAMPFLVDEFVKMGRYAHQSAFSDWTQQDQQAVESALAITNCSAFQFRPMQTLSGGECQRVMIAAALAQEAPILLLDEPTSFLDPHHQVEVHQLIQRLNREHGKTIVEVTHDINHASQHAKHILALREGKTLWQGAAGDFLQSTRLKQLYDQDFIFLSHPQTQRLIALIDEDT